LYIYFLAEVSSLHISRRYFCTHFWRVRCLLPHPTWFHYPKIFDKYYKR